MKSLLGRAVGEDVQLQTVLETELGRVNADASQIERLLMNLAVNARDAMQNGGKLVIETANVELDERFVAQHPGAGVGAHVLLAVSDTGCGMDAETLASIFEPFFTTKPQGEGTGLGLSTVYGIVKQSGGSIWAGSEPGLGTTFKIYLPRVQALLDESSAAPCEGRPGPGSVTVLLVEDDNVVRTLARRALTDNGYEVFDARHANKAVLFFESADRRIDLVLTDVVMPDTSGPRLAERLTEFAPDVKVLYMSGYSEAPVFGDDAPGADRPFVQKPFTPAALVEKVCAVLDERA